jgi:hypothetical protein
MKVRYSIVSGTAALLLLASAYGQETVKPLGREWTVFEFITGFHHVFDRDNQFELRVLESDVSATVALNPVYIYLVITNNSSAADLQRYVWLLPYKVSKVKGVKLLDSVLQIQAEVDADPWNPSKRVRRRLSVRYSVSHGVLSDTLSVSEKPL